MDTKQKVLWVLVGTIIVPVVAIYIAGQVILPLN